MIRKNTMLQCHDHIKDMCVLTKSLIWFNITIFMLYDIVLSSHCDEPSPLIAQSAKHFQTSQCDEYNAFSQCDVKNPLSQCDKRSPTLKWNEHLLTSQWDEHKPLSYVTFMLIPRYVTKLFSLWQCNELSDVAMIWT